MLGRLDSQVSVGGLKVDLTEVEHTLTELPGVAAAVVLYDKDITAFVQLTGDATGAAVEAALAERVAGYKRPRTTHFLKPCHAPRRGSSSATAPCCAPRCRETRAWQWFPRRPIRNDSRR